MKLCAKCHLPLAFKQLESGKWCPTNPDGSDHWDLCRETRIAAMSPLERALLARRDAIAAAPVWTGTTKYVWNGTIAPWDNSLGPFRKFTKAEEQDRSVTRKWTKPKKVA